MSEPICRLCVAIRAGALAVSSPLPLRSAFPFSESVLNSAMIIAGACLGHLHVKRTLPNLNTHRAHVARPLQDHFRERCVVVTYMANHNINPSWDADVAFGHPKNRMTSAANTPPMAARLHHRRLSRESGMELL